MCRFLGVVSFCLLPYLSASAAAVAEQCSLITAPLKSFVLIGMDDISVPIQVDFVPEDMCYHADFNGDGRADTIVESGLNGGTSAILYAGSGGQFTAIEYAWENVNTIRVEAHFILDKTIALTNKVFSLYEYRSDVGKLVL